VALTVTFVVTVFAVVAPLRAVKIPAAVPATSRAASNDSPSALRMQKSSSEDRALGRAYQRPPALRCSQRGTWSTARPDGTDGPSSVGHAERSTGPPDLAAKREKN